MELEVFLVERRAFRAGSVWALIEVVAFEVHDGPFESLPADRGKNQ